MCISSVHFSLRTSHSLFQVIPRANKFPQRRYGGSLRCTTNPHRQVHEGDRDGSLSSGYGSGSGATHSVGRSNSFRFNRPRNAFSSSSSTGLNSLGVAGTVSGTVGGGLPCIAGLGQNKLSGSSSSLLCKHIKYCCLHQQQKNLSDNMPSCNQQQQLFQQQPSSSSLTSSSSNQHQQPSIHFIQKQSHHSDYIAQTSNGCGNSNSINNINNCCNHTTATLGGGGGGVAASAATRLGPDGEDNTTSDILNNGLTNCLANGQLHQQQHHPHHHQQHHLQHQPFNHAHHQPTTLSLSHTAITTNSQQNKHQLQKRHSIILERAFDFGK